MFQVYVVFSDYGRVPDVHKIHGKVDEIMNDNMFTTELQGTVWRTPELTRFIDISEFGRTENLRITMNIIRPDYTSYGIRNVAEIDDNDDDDPSLPELSKKDLSAAQLVNLGDGDGAGAGADFSDHGFSDDSEKEMGFGKVVKKHKKKNHKKKKSQKTSKKTYKAHIDFN